MKPKIAKPKTKRCCICKQRFVYMNTFDKVCGDIECKVAFGVEAAEKSRSKREAEARRNFIAEKKAHRDAVLKTKKLSYFADKAQVQVNAYRRELLVGMPCISCGRNHEGQIHAGHYIPRGRQPALRYTEINIWPQCKPCNVDLSGNAIEYRKSLVKIIGLELVEWLEGPHELMRLRREDYESIEAEYKKKRKELKCSVE